MKKIIEIDRCTSCPYFHRLVGKDYKLVFVCFGRTKTASLNHDVSKAIPDDCPLETAKEEIK